MNNNDFNILIGVDLSNAENKISDMITSIGKNYKLELELIIGNKSKFFKQIKTIQSLFKNIGKIDFDLGLGEGSREAELMKSKLKDLGNVDLSEAGEELAKTMEEATRNIEQARKAYDDLMKVVDKTQKSGFVTQSKKVGNQFMNVTESRLMKDANGAIINEGKGKIIDTSITRDFDALVKYVDKSVSSINSLSNVTGMYNIEIDELKNRLFQLHTLLDKGDQSFVDEVKSINSLLEHYGKLENEMIQVSHARQAADKESLKWANKLEEVERKAYANPASIKKMNRLVGELDGDFKNLDKLQKKLVEIQAQYSKIQAQERDIAFRRNVKNQYDNTHNKLITNGKIQGNFLSENDTKKLVEGVEGIKEAKTQLQLENALKKVNRQYDEMLRKQAEAIRLQQEQTQQADDLADLQKHLSDIETERARLAHDAKAKEHEVNERAKKVEDKEREVASERTKMVGSGLIDSSEFDEVEDRLRELGRLAKNEYVENLDVDKELQETEKMMKKIIDRYEELDGKSREIRRSTHDWNKEIDQIKNTGFVNESEFTKVREMMRNLSADSKTYQNDLKAIESRINRLNAVADKRKDRQETRDINKNRNNVKLESMRGTVPDNIIDNVKGLNSMVDFSSSKTDIAFIEDEMKKIVKLNDEITKANKEQAKIQDVIEDYRRQTVKSTDKHQDALNEIVHQMNRQVLDAQRKNDLENEAIVIQKEINALRERGTEISYEENRAIQQRLLALRQLSQRQRDVEGEDQYVSSTTQRIKDKFFSNSYRATRGFRENSNERIELQQMVNNIQGMVDGLGGKVGGEFRKATEEIESAMNALNHKSRELRDEDQRKRSSMGGQLANAMRKVPVWTSAMEIFYGTLNQIRQGFQQLLDLDAAMVNLQKVTESSKLELEAFKSQASAIGKELGVVATEVVKATTEFQKLGYTLEQSTMLGKNTILYANVGDMDVETASGNLVSTIKGFNVVVDEQGHNVRNLVDMFNEVGNNFAVSSEGIGEALKRSSAVMYEAGNTIEESVGLVASANAVIQDPKKVGNALKTIAMRLRGVSDEGEDVSQLVPDLQIMFERINKEFNLIGDNALNLMEADGTTFKSTYEIFDQIQQVWDKLSDIERANLVETMGGKHQGVVVSAIINNWKDAESAAQTAGNSAGSALREFEAYMDGFEYKIGQLQNALEHFWTTVINDDAIKGLIDGLTNLIEVLTDVVDTVGAGTLLSVLSGIGGLFMSKGLRDTVFPMLSKEVKTIADYAKGLWSWGSRIVKLIPRFLGYVGIVFAIAKGVQMIYNWVTKASRERKEQLKVLDQEITKLEEISDKYRQIFDERSKNDRLDRFGLLQAKGSLRSSEEEQEFFEITQQIKDEFPDLIAYYDEYGNAVAKAANEIRLLREENERTQLRKEVDEFDLTLEDTNFKEIDKAMKPVGGIQERIQGTYGSEKLNEFAREYIENQMAVFTEENYFDEMTKFNDRMAQEFLNLPKEQQKYAEAEYNKILSFVRLARDKGEMFDFLKIHTENIAYDREEYEKEQEKVGTTISAGMDNFNKLFDTAFNLEMRDRNISANTNQFKFIDDMRKGMLENIYKFGADSETIIRDIPKYIDEVVKMVSDTGLSFDDLLELKPETAEQTIADIDKIKRALLTQNPNNSLYQILIDQLDDLRTAHQNAYFEIQNKHIVPFSIEQHVMPQVNNFIDSISDLDSAYRELSDSGEMSLSTTMDLIAKHPELIKSMKMENGVLKLTQKSLKELAEIKEREFKRDLEIKLEKAKAAKTAAEEEIKANLDIAKSLVEVNNVRAALVYNPDEKITELEKDIKAKDYQQNSPIANRPKLPTLPRIGQPIDENQTVSFGNEGRSKEDMVNELAYWQAMKAVNENKEASNKAQENIDALEKLLAQDWSGQLGNITGGNKDKSKNIQDGFYVIDEYTKSINRYNDAIAKQQRLQARYSTFSQTYQKSLNDELWLTNEKKKAIDAEIASLNKQIEANSIRKVGLVTVDENGNENKTARLIAAEIQQEIDQARDRLRGLQTESAEAAVRANEIQMSMVRSRIEAFENQRAMLTDDIAYQEYAMGLYEETSESYRVHAKEKLSLLEEQMKYHKQELALLEEEKKSNKTLNNAQINELNELIRAKREAVLEMAETIQETNTLIAQSSLNHYLNKFSSESKKYADAIDEIEDKMKYDLDDKDYAKNIDFLQQIVALRKGESKDAANTIRFLEKQLETYRDNKEMVEQITDEIEAWKNNLKGAENAIKDINLEIKDIFEKMSDEYVDLYKEQLQLMQEADSKYYENKIKSETKAHEQRIKQIEKESKALQDAYDKQMKLIDRAESSRDHTNELSKLQKEANELRKQIDLLAMDDSYEAKSRRAELTKQLTEKEMDIEEKKHDREIELRKNDLEDTFESEQEKLDKRKESLNEQHNKLIESLEGEAEIKQKYWEDELQNEIKFAQLRQEVLDGNFSNMLETITTWKTNVESEMGSLGETITDNFTKKVEDAIKAIEDLKKANIGSAQSIVKNEKPVNLDGDSNENETPPKNNELNASDKVRSTVREMYENSKQWRLITGTSDADNEEKKRLHGKNLELGKKIGATYDTKKGEWFDKDGKRLYSLIGLKTGGYTGDWSGDEGRVALLHKKELVLNDVQTKHILDTARIIEKFKSILPSFNAMKNITPAKSSEPTSGVAEHNEYNIEVNVNGNADKKVADTVADQIVKKIKRTKGGRF